MKPFALAHAGWKRWLAVLALLMASGPVLLFFINRQPSVEGLRVGRGAGPCGPERELHPASPPIRGDDVWELQLRLRELGYYSGPLNGVYDRATVAAVRALQISRGAKATGWVTRETWRLLAGPGEPRPAARIHSPPDGEIVLVVDIYNQKLTVYSNGRPFKEYDVAVGKPWTPSPPGEWRIVEKTFESGGVFGTRWMGLNVPWGVYGIHGTDRPWSIGYAASAGCIRMNNQDIEELFNWVPVGTPVKMIGPLPDDIREELRPGIISQSVVALQIALRAAGFSAGLADGRFGRDTERAVRRFQTFYGLPVDGRAGGAELYLLGLRQWRSPGGGHGQ